MADLLEHRQNEMEPLRKAKATYETLLKATREMRKLQKEYFKTRDRGILQQSKDKEREVDNLIRVQEPDLFTPTKNE